MPPLPIRPWIFVVACVALIAALFAAMVAGSQAVTRYALSPIQFGVMAFQIVWIWQALRFATAQLRLRGGTARADLNQKIAVVLTACLVVGLTPFIVFLLATGPIPDAATMPRVVSLFMPLGMVGMFGLFWIAGRALGDAERAVGVSNPNILGIAVQFGYLVVFAPALYRRLQALERPAQKATSQTA